jgi:tetratricopeptide (TPR) repeat protein
MTGKPSLMLVFVLTLCAATPGVLAQSSADARRNALFQDMLANPADLDVAFEYARLAAEAGDLEGAISTLERMLIFAPGLARLQLELGVLYFRLGAYETAESYFAAVMSAPDVPADVLERVKVFRRAIEANRDTNPLSFYSLSGLRWQSNANNATATSDIILNGLPFVLDSEYTAQSDWSFVSSNSLAYSHDLQNQGDTFDFGLATYSAIYFDLTDLNTQLAEAVAGPSFNLARYDIENTFASVYGIAGGALLGQQVYFGSLGAGGAVRTVLNERTRGVGRLEYRHRWYENSSDLPYNDWRTGDEIRAAGFVSYLVTSDLVVSGGARLARQNVDADFYSGWEFGFEASATQTFRSPLPSLASDDWAIGANVLYIRRDYDEPDPTINADDAEWDDYFSATASLTVPVSEHFAMVPQVQYQNQDSNYPLQQFETWTIFVGLAARF